MSQTLLALTIFAMKSVAECVDKPGSNQRTHPILLVFGDSHSQRTAAITMCFAKRIFVRRFMDMSYGHISK